jgi:hypothetical protein
MIGDLRLTRDGRWVTEPPTHCPNGHALGGGQVLVGHTACAGHGGGHVVWNCRTCEEMVYGPPLNTHCTVLDVPRSRAHQ